MRQRIQKADAKTWTTIGRSAKECETKIRALVHQASPHLPLRVTDCLLKALGVLNEFKSAAEEEMFRRDGPQDTSIFYGRKGGRLLIWPRSEGPQKTRRGRVARFLSKGFRTRVGGETAILGHQARSGKQP